MKLELNVNVLFSQDQLEWIMKAIQSMPEYPPEGCPVHIGLEDDDEDPWDSNEVVC